MRAPPPPCSACAATSAPAVCHAPTCKHVLYGLPWFHITHLQHLDLLTHISWDGLAAGHVAKALSLCTEKPGWFRPARPQPQRPAAAAGNDAAAEGTLAVFSALIDHVCVAGLVQRHAIQPATA